MTSIPETFQESVGQYESTYFLSAFHHDMYLILVFSSPICQLSLPLSSKKKPVTSAAILTHILLIPKLDFFFLTYAIFVGFRNLSVGTL